MRLTDRQHELARHRLAGDSIDEIAKKTKCKPESVKFMFHQIYLKLGLELTNEISHKEKIERFRAAYGIYQEINSKSLKSKEIKI
jgi:DNA-binding CsgD family transcriptional regulator